MEISDNIAFDVCEADRPINFVALLCLDPNQDEHQNKCNVNAERKAKHKKIASLVRRLTVKHLSGSFIWNFLVATVLLINVKFFLPVVEKHRVVILVLGVALGKILYDTVKYRLR